MALHEALHYRDWERAGIVLNGTNASESFMGRLPLHIAAERGAEPALVQRLLALFPEGAHIPDETHAGQTALHIAAGANAPLAVIELLLAGGANRAAEDWRATVAWEDGRWRLRLAPRGRGSPSDGCGYGAGQLSEGCQTATRPIAAVDAKGCSALHAAAGCREVALAVVQLLLNADPGAARRPDASGALPLHLAAGDGSAEVAAVLLQLAPHTVVRGSSQHAHTPHARWKQPRLMPSPACQRACDQSGKTALHWAAMKDAPLPLVLLLLRANPQAARCLDTLSQTPLHLVSRQRSNTAIEGAPQPTLWVARHPERSCWPVAMALLEACPLAVTWRQKDGVGLQPMATRGHQRHWPPHHGIAAPGQRRTGGRTPGQGVRPRSWRPPGTARSAAKGWRGCCGAGGLSSSRFAGTARSSG
jgi:ankyrin repeat protein